MSKLTKLDAQEVAVLRHWLGDIYNHFPYEAIRGMLFARPDTMTNDDISLAIEKLINLSLPFWEYEREHGPQPLFGFTQVYDDVSEYTVNTPETVAKTKIGVMTPAACRAELAAQEANQALVDSWLTNYQKEQVA